MKTGKIRRGGALAAVLIGIAAVAALSVAGLILFGAWFSSHTHVVESKGRVNVETPFGSVRVKRQAGVDARLFGVPVYPGATRNDDHRKVASVEFDFGDDHKELTIVTAEYTTPDPAEKVVDFYKANLTKWIVRRSRHGGWELRVNEHGNERVVVIRERGGETHIGLASMGEPAAN
ncbi:MAG: hypothetical protein ACE15B_04350 [Bryobacteraceae bacterium]